jgi:uncharacterized protein YdaL
MVCGFFRRWCAASQRVILAGVMRALMCLLLLGGGAGAWADEVDEALRFEPAPAWSRLPAAVGAAEAEAVVRERLGLLEAPQRPAAVKIPHRPRRLAALPSGSARPSERLLRAGRPGRGQDRPRLLVLYDTTGAWGFLGEMYAQQTVNLASRFAQWQAQPVTSYAAGSLTDYTHVIYIGSTFDEPLPAAFLEDVRAGTRPVMWMFDNIWQLTAENPAFATDSGWMWTGFDTAAIPAVEYKGTLLERDTVNNGGGIMGTVVNDAARTEVLATAVSADGRRLPWALRSGQFTYLTEVPFSYVGPNDRYLVFADLLTGFLAPSTQERHRALVRLEDVGPDADPAELRAIADLLASRKVPFSVAVFPEYRDPRGAYHDGIPTRYTLAQRPAVVAALRYMRWKGGTLIMHGYTHQYSDAINPYTGASKDDFEFFTAFVDQNDSVIYTGPVAEDSTRWANGRIRASMRRFMEAGLFVPDIFEFPHYAGSENAYRAVARHFDRRYDRGLYYPGLLTGQPADHSRLNGQFFPWPVRDLYGSLVLPENLGNIEPEAFNNHPARFPADLLATAQKNLVIRDGFASFFYHPYLGTQMLAEVVDGLKAQGWTFVSPQSIRRVTD